MYPSKLFFSNSYENHKINIIDFIKIRSKGNKILHLLHKYPEENIKVRSYFYKNMFG